MDPKRQARVEEALAEYMRRVDADERVDQAAFLAAHADVADDLQSYFDDAEQVGELARQSREKDRCAAGDDHSRLHPDDVAGDGIGTSSPPAADARELDLGGLRIRCPDCHQPIEVLPDEIASDVTCHACGSTFNLLKERPGTYTTPTLKRIGHFELIDRIGVGAYGAVWKARDTELDRAVAVKIPRRDKIDPQDLEKFLREARAAAQLHHPNIVSIHEVGRDGESVYIVSELIRGVSLADWMTGQKLTAREATELCRKLALALHHAHEAGIVHRDLKPGNILIDQQGEPHVADFGLAKRDAGEITVTIDGVPLGTPAYMPPEQARGEAHAADRRSDVYSLGAVLFELLTGERPFRGNPRMLLYQVMNEDAPSPRSLNAAVPHDLETIVLKCLEKPTAKRYATAADLADELQRFLDGKPIHARPISRAARAWRWCLRNRLVASLGALLITSLLTGAIVATVLLLDTRRHAREAERRGEELRISAQKRSQMVELLLQEVTSRDRDARSVKLERLAKLERELLEETAGSTQELVARHATGVKWFDLHELDKALDQFQRALQLVENDRLGDQEDRMLLRNRIATTLQVARRLDEAVTMRHENLELVRQLLGPQHAYVFLAQLNLVSTLLEHGRFDRAILEFKNALEQGARYSPTGRETLESIRMARRMTEMLADAARSRENVDVKVLRANFRDTHQLLLDILKRVEAPLCAAGDDQSLKALHDLALALATAHMGATGDVETPAVAVELLKKTLAASEKLLGVESTQSLESTLELAKMYRRLGQRSESAKLLEPALGRASTKLGRENSLTLQMQLELVRVRQAKKVSPPASP